MDAKVQNFCQQCPQCQCTVPKKPAPTPLFPLHINDIPFERVGIDLVGSLPKSARVHEYILVIVAYAARYPDTFTLYGCNPHWE